MRLQKPYSDPGLENQGTNQGRLKKRPITHYNGPPPPLNLHFKHGSLTLCIPYLGLANKEDSFGLSILLGYLEDPKYGKMASRKFHALLKEIKSELGI